MSVFKLLLIELLLAANFMHTLGKANFASVAKENKSSQSTTESGSKPLLKRRIIRRPTAESSNQTLPSSARKPPSLSSESVPKALESLQSTMTTANDPITKEYASNPTVYASNPTVPDEISSIGGHNSSQIFFTEVLSKSMSDKDFTKEILDRNPWHIFSRYLIKVYPSLYLQQGDHKNQVISPLGLNMGVISLLAGSKGTSYAELKDLLDAHTFWDIELFDLWRCTLTTLKSISENSQFKISNDLFVDESYPQTPSYLQITKSLNGKWPELADFTSTLTVDKVNNWIAQATNNKYKNAYKSNSFKPNSKLILFNVVYFRGPWKVTFKKELTHPGSFQSFDGAKSIYQVYMMHNPFLHVMYGRFDYLRSEMVEIPFENDRYAIKFFLPLADTKEEFIATQRMLYHHNVMDCIGERKPINLTLPKFKFTSAYSLQDPLHEIGVSYVFSKFANFFAISKKPGMSLTDIRLNYYFEINENGTDAQGSATSETTLASTSHQKTMVFNRSFFFALVDKKVNVVLQQGQVTSPTKVYMR